MNVISLIYGLHGNAKAKRARRGMEKDWNQYDEALRKFMKHGDSMKRSKRWIEHRRKKSEKPLDKSDDLL